MGCNNDGCMCTHLHVPAAHLGFAFVSLHVTLHYHCGIFVLPGSPLFLSMSVTAPFPGEPSMFTIPCCTSCSPLINNDSKPMSSNAIHHICFIPANCDRPPPSSSCCMTMVETKGQVVWADKWCGPTGTSRNANHLYCGPCKGNSSFWFFLNSKCYNLLKLT